MLKRLAVLSVLVVTSATLAHATSISGIISVGGNDSFTGSSITFLPPEYIAGVSTGSFTPFTVLNPVTMFPTTPPGSALPFALGFQTVLSRLGTTSILALTSTEGATTLDFFMTDYSVSIVSGVTGCSETCLDVTGDGFFTETGFDQTPGSFTFTTQDPTLSGKDVVNFSATGFATPEPSSLMLLGTGILGLAGIARRKIKA